jgi:hypothetical protein
MKLNKEVCRKCFNSHHFKDDFKEMDFEVYWFGNHKNKRQKCAVGYFIKIKCPYRLEHLVNQKV